MGLWYDNPKAKPSAIARLPGSSIPDGAMVLASYDYVSHYRAPQPDELHIPYVLLEPETQRLMSAFMFDLARSDSFPYIHISADIHEFFVTDAMLATDSRVIKSGKKPIQLFAENTLFWLGGQTGEPQDTGFSVDRRHKATLRQAADLFCPEIRTSMSGATMPVGQLSMVGKQWSTGPN